MMDNPLMRIRKEKGLTVADMGILSGVSTVTITRIEKGNLKKVSPDVLAVLERWGYKAEQIQAEYDKWKSHWIKQKYKELGL